MMGGMPTTRAGLLGPPPTDELGAPGLSSYGGWLDTWEDNPALRFPLSAKVFDKMRTDGQVDAVNRAADLPILRNRRRLNGDGCDPRVVAFVADELGLDLDRRTAHRRRRFGAGIVYMDLLRHALLKRTFGFMPFEQVYRPGPPNPGQETLGLPATVFHLHKLAPRMPRSVTAVDVATDGGLEGIRQMVPRRIDGGIAAMTSEVKIGRDRLVMMVNNREGGDWTGRSYLRSSYGHWLIKQALLKLGPMTVERNGMGVPVVTYGAGHSQADALAVARGFRAGEDAGAALPEGMTIDLVALKGNLKDELPLLHYHDQAIGRTALAMFLNLGHDNGARSLGETMVDYFLMAEMGDIDGINADLEAYAIADLVAANFGADEPYPTIEEDELTADGAPTAEGLAALANGGLLDADPDLKAELRRRFRLPLPPEEEAPHVPVPGATLPGAPGEPAPVAGVDDITELPPGAAVPPGMTPDELLKMVNAAAALIRSGFAPDASLIAVGLSPIDHLGLLPVTVQKPLQEVAGLAAAPTPGPLDVARALAGAQERHNARLTAATPAAGDHGSIAARAAAIAQRAATIAQAHQ